MNLSGRAIVVTGGTTGVGRATAILFAKSGARAIAICGRNEGKGARVVNELLDLGADAIFIRADLAPMIAIR